MVVWWGAGGAVPSGLSKRAPDTDPTDPHWAVTSGLSKRAAPNPIRPLWKPSLKN